MVCSELSPASYANTNSKKFVNCRIVENNPTTLDLSKVSFTESMYLSTILLLQFQTKWNIHKNALKGYTSMEQFFEVMSTGFISLQVLNNKTVKAGEEFYCDYNSSAPWFEVVTSDGSAFPTHTKASGQVFCFFHM
jgi:hypothetical protein